MLADFILRYDFANKIRFHCKAIPWFISDVVDVVYNRDFHWTIEKLANDESITVKAIGNHLTDYVNGDHLESRPI